MLTKSLKVYRGLLKALGNPVDPVIAYKTAELRPAAPQIFKGVAGSRGYDAVAEATGHGFHMYESITEALEHPQGTNTIFLEVVGYGDVVTWEKGWTTSHQKIVQVIFGRCCRQKCSRQAEYWAYIARNGLPLHRDDTNSREIRVWCREHRSPLMLVDGKLEPTEVNHRRELEALLEQRAGYKIPVVGTEEGYDIPTYVRSQFSDDKMAVRGQSTQTTNV